MNGRCQGFFCAAEVRGYLDQAEAVRPAGPPARGVRRASSSWGRAVGAARGDGPGFAARRPGARRPGARAGAGEEVAGGVPRHCDHLGYGMRDLGRLTTGPRYARIMVARAEAAGARIRTSTMVTGWAGERGLEVTSPAGREVIRPDVIMATGAHERDRERPG